MRKSLNLFILSFALLFAVVINVSAEEVSVDTEAKLNTCVQTEGNVCKLAGNITRANPLEIGKEVTIDLNGYSITPGATFSSDSVVIVLHGGTLTVEDSKGTGKISTTDADSDIFVGIKMTKAGGDDSKEATLFVNAGTIEGYDYGISGNGNSGRGNTVVSITGGTVKGLSATGAGIFNPQEGIVLIEGGKVMGATGIEMRSGTLLVSGGTIEATKAFSVTPTGNGSTTTGVGVAVAQHTTGKDLMVAITGGTVKGEKAVYQSNVQNNKAEVVEKVQVGIVGGTFEGNVESENLKEFIAGGTFNTQVDETYISTNSDIETSNNGTVVKTAWNIEIKRTENGTVIAKETAYEGETVKLDIKAAEGYEVDTIKVIEALYNSEVEVKDNSFTMTNAPVEVEVTFKKVEVKETSKEEVKVNDEKNPNTGDNIVTFVIIGLISLIVAGVAINKLRKNA